MITVKIILGSTREGRFGEKPAQWIVEKVQKREGVEAELLDLRDYPMPFYDAAISPKMLNGVYPHEAVARWAKKIDEADAFLIATPEYNHGYSAVLKNALDWTYPEWNNKPVGLVGWGSVSGARAIEQLREVAVEFQMAPIRNSVLIPSPWLLTDKDGNFKTEPFEESADAMIEQLLWWAKALKDARRNTA